MADNEVERLVGIINGTLRDHEGRLSTLEKNDVRQDQQISHILTDLGEIKSNTTWILRIVIGAIVMALLGWIIVKPAPTTKVTLNENSGVSRVAEAYCRS